MGMNVARLIVDDYLGVTATPTEEKKEASKLITDEL